MKYLFVLLFSVSAYAQTDLEKEKQLSAEYLSKMSQEAGAQTLEQGVVVRPIFVSDSKEFPLPTDSVHVTYHLSDREGTLIEESATSDELIVFPLGRLIKCWQIALPKMNVGSFFKITCPSDTAYGDKGVEDVIKPGAALTFRITLFGVSH